MTVTSKRTHATMSAASDAPFRASTSQEARGLTDGAMLSSLNGNSSVLMPWVGFGTYRLGKKHSYQSTLDALQEGYRAIDTAFIYGGETTETQVGLALQKTFEESSLKRDEVFVITKHWRKYHGYEPTLKCLNLSLKRLQLDYVDLYLMHWPGPAWKTMNRRKDRMELYGKWHYAATSQEDMIQVRAETWRAMEDALRQHKARAIGVSNFTIQHLETLKETATIWPPAVNQVECHPLYPQTELLQYCQKEGIVVQAYAALGGQDATKKQWHELLGGHKLIDAPIVRDIASSLERTPAQVLLRWALQRNCALTPKATSSERMYRFLIFSYRKVK